MSDKSKFYYLFTNEDLSIINIFGNCIIECLETRKLKQGLWYWNIFSLSVYIINYFLRLWTRQETLYLYIQVCIIASNENNQCMQFVCPYCGPIDWNNKYSYSYIYRYLARRKILAKFYRKIQHKTIETLTCYYYCFVFNI